MKVLIIEDDEKVAQAVKNRLVSDDHTVEISVDGADGSFLARSYAYDAIVLDYSLPKKNGLDVCKEIRSIGKTTPIIFLSVTDDIDTKLAALDSGADDYLTKPFSLGELYSRIKAITRRPNQIRQSVLKVHDLTLDSDRHILMRDKRRVQVTHKEFNLLEYFMRNAGIVLSRSMIMEHVWTADSNPFSNTVEAHIGSIRKKLNLNNKPNLIANIPGRGYVMDSPEKLRRF